MGLTPRTRLALCTGKDQNNGAILFAHNHTVFIDMSRQLFDLAGANDEIRFSPYCWRTKMALKHKGLDFDAVAWRFTEKQRLEQSGQGRVPVLVDGESIVHDSWAIAEYLDATYPDRPALMRDAPAKAAAKLTQAWTDRTVFGPLRPIAVKAVWDLLDETDRGYFRESREKMLGRPLEEVSSQEAIERANVELKSVLAPAEVTLKEFAYLGGDEPYYGDYVLFGTLMWPHCVSGQFALDTDTATAAWFDRMLNLYDGYAAAAARAAA